MITPSFHFEVLRGFVQTFGEQASILVKLLDAKADTGECMCAAAAMHRPHPSLSEGADALTPAWGAVWRARL